MNDILTLKVSSPDDLRDQIARAFANAPKKYSGVSIAIHNPDVFVYPFTINNAGVPEIRKQLFSQAVELLTLPVTEIELDYQIFNTSADKLSGVFICIPKKLLGEFLSVLDRAKLTPLKITARMLASMDGFFMENKTSPQRFACLDFLGDCVHLAVYNNGLVELVREISVNEPAEAKNDIIQSLRSASARSPVKRLDRIYYSGVKDDTIIPELERIFQTMSEQKVFNDVKKALSPAGTFFSLNFLRNYVLSAEKRKQIYKVTSAVLGLIVVVCAVLAFAIYQKSRAIREISSSYQTAEYQYAKNLHELLNTFQ